ncbi:DapH/DapD/GlmU-related protein [Novosphingobium sp. HR1a]|nr:acyltransferase [Novosphingobium sp. HR1a]
MDVLVTWGRRAIPSRLWMGMRRFRDATHCRAAKRTSLAPGSLVGKHSQVLGWRSVKLGRNAVVGDGAVLNVNHRGRNSVQIAVGHSSFVGARSFFSPAELIEIGAFALVGIDCKFLGAGHLYSDPMKPYIATGTSTEGRMVIGTNCWLGVGVTVLGSVTIGHGSVIGANSFVRSNIPPFSIAIGDPARVIRRYDPIGRDWVATDQFTPEMDAALPDPESYLAALEAQHPNLAIPVLAAGPSQGDLP